MRFHILTLFPEMVLSGLNTSILGRALEKGIIELDAVNIRDYTKDRHKKVDDYPYGGGAGMLMQAQPVYDAWRAAVSKNTDGRPARVIYVTPQGRVFDQEMARELAKEEELVFLCGHYEGIDERVLEEIVTDYVSIGDYVLTGGELPAMVMIDAISRMVPGVLKNEESGEFESFHENLLEYPQYTRPEEWEGRKVPAVLLSGDHAKVEQWRLEQSIERTKKRRPDFYEKYDLPGRALEWLGRDRLLHMDMIEGIRRGTAEVLAVLEKGVILRDRATGFYMISAEDKDAGERLLSLAEPSGEAFLCHQKFLAESVTARFQREWAAGLFQMAYTRKQPFEEDPDVLIRPLGEGFADQIFAHYNRLVTRDELVRLLKNGSVYGAFLPAAADTAADRPAASAEGQTTAADMAADRSDVPTERQEQSAADAAEAQTEPDGCREVLAGFIGTHAEGSMGMLQVLEEYRGRGIAQALEKYLINRTLERGETPYCQVFADNQASLKLQEKLGLKAGRKKIYWIS